MNQHKPYQRFFAIVLSAVMVLGLMPTSAAAEDILPGTSAKIISFGGLEEAKRTVPLGTDLEDLNLPKKLTAMVHLVTDTDNYEKEEPIGEPGEPEQQGDKEELLLEDGQPDSVPDENKLQEEPAVGAVEITVPVTWADSPNYDGEKAGIYIFTAEIAGFTVDAEPPSIIVTVGEMKGNITSFDELADNIRWQNTTEPIFPATLAGTVEGEAAQIPITWEADHDYDMESPVKGLYVFTAQPGEGYALGDGVKAPHITVYIPVTAAHMTLFSMAVGGTGDDSLEITTADQLAEIAVLVNLGRLKSFLFNDESGKVTLILQNDIDLSAYGRNWNDGKGWTPIGYNYDRPFREIFDGGGYKITGLYIETTAGNHYGGTGLFGYVDGGTVQNLGIADVNITGGGYTGGVAGSIDAGSTVQNCYVTGIVSGEGYAGGMAGAAYGSSTVQNCYTTSTVNGESYAGGIAGAAYGNSTVQNCYATGIVGGSGYAGGVAGCVDGGTVKNCAGLNHSVTAASDTTIGRVIGFQGSGTFSGNAAFGGMTVSVSGVAQTTASSTTGKDGLDKNPVEIKAENFWTASSGFTGDWDTSVWTIAADSLPGLFGIPVEMPVHIVDGGNLNFRGEGTQENPYQISTAAQLAKLAELVNDLAANPTYGGAGIYYNLTADIDLSGYNAANTAFNGGRGWVPIGYGDFNTFEGNFNGNGHKITGLYIKTTAGDHYDSTGLFGSLYGGSVQNLGVVGADITGFDNVGGVAGYIYNNSRVQNCYVTGSVTGNDDVGGVAGVVKSNSRVQNCYAVGSVTGRQCVGGMAGYVYGAGIVENCYTTAAVDAARCIGGVAGAVDGPGAKVQNCYSTGAVSGTSDEIGGVAGYVYNGGAVESCYAAGAVTGGIRVGGVVGVVNPAGTVKNCAALNPSVSGDGSVGRIAGVVTANGISSDNMAFGGITVMVDNVPRAVIDDANGMDGESKDADVLKTPAGFPEALETSPWSYTEGKRPILMDSTGNTVLPGQDETLPYHISGQCFAGGGTSGSPYEITTDAQLAKLAELVNTGTAPYAEAGKYYKLTANIDLSAYQSGEGWIPIGADFTNAFKGIFEGDGKVITGLYIKGTGTCTGLFGCVKGGTVQNLGIVGASIAGAVSGTGNDIGGVAGIVDGNGMVQNCYATGTVSGASYVGGVAGSATGSSTVQNCYASGAVSGTGNYVGGVAGSVDGSSTVQNCYATDTVSGASYVGGVAGSADGGSTVKNSVGLNPSVSGVSNVGRVVGNNNGSTLLNNYAFSGMSGGSAKTLTGLDGEDLTIAQANTAAFWTDASNWDLSSWDAASIWTITDNKLPLLQKVEGTQSGGGLYLTERDISKATATVNGSYTYTGSEIIPQLFVTFDGETLAEGVDYTMSCSSNINAGTALVTLTGRGNFKGIKNVNFTIGKKMPAKDNLEFDLTPVVYNGSERMVSIIKKDGVTGLGNITVKYSGGISAPVNAGEYAVTVDIAEGINYKAVSGLSLGTYTIEKKQVIVRADDKVVKAGEPLPAATVSYTGFIGTDSKDNALADEAIAEYDAASTSAAGTSPVKIAANAVLNDTVGANYTLVYQNGTLTVTGEEIFTIGAKAEANGSISPSGAVQVAKGESQTFTITPDSGYQISSVTVDGVDKGITSSYTFSAVSANHTISAVFISSRDDGSNDGDSSAIIALAKKLDQPTIASVSAKARISGGRTVMVITDDMVQTAIEKAQLEAKIKGTVTNGIGVEISVTAPGAAGFTLVTERAALNRLVKEARMFEVSGLPVTVKFDLTALKKIQGQSDSDITISASPVTAGGLRSAFDIKITSTRKGKPVGITSLGNGSVIIGIAATPGKGEYSGCFYGAAMGKDRKISRIANSVYDGNSGCVIFTTNQIQVYGVGYKALSAKFTDISTHWAKESIDYVAGRGLISGTSDTTFSPDAAMTRGMLVTALGRLAGGDVSGYKTSSFTDVAADKYYSPYIEWAYRKGIVQDGGNSRFAPDGAVTREEVAVIMANFAGVTGCTLPVAREASAYADDLNIGNSCKTAVKAMQQAGIMTGGRGNKFNPKSSATRGEVSAMLHRYVKLAITPDTAKGWALNDAGQYLCYKDGKALTGWQTVNGVKYCFESDGTLQTGWVKDGENWRFYYGNKVLISWWNIGVKENNKLLLALLNEGAGAGTKSYRKIP
ncbi:GLUG motif-containing protein [Anaerocolumna xylanovorans]|uniref:S-layer homology domain-containing protein n=1 Tax=Anaerocolumna xylanovorans DSM 12503 TaxID=1121345 RepID=A0A1M7YN22_9FIRM|nr:GLUG motif-containing protein [Anaerocolumna xylanovorans]SHO53956.1 S-layer homology domain-containing protein [Anaerocolumna xylanovorans DSM 12503]